VALLDSYVIVSPDNVHFGIIVAFDKGIIDHVIDAGKGVLSLIIWLFTFL
jgi:hypothetical protein